MSKTLATKERKPITNEVIPGIHIPANLPKRKGLVVGHIYQLPRLMKVKIECQTRKGPIKKSIEVEKGRVISTTRKTYTLIGPEAGGKSTKKYIYELTKREVKDLQRGIRRC